ncbi:MAG: hypothetical protein K9L30_04200 [Desulfobacterales bacterium]|nr:hypothetical protein [Desulfobacterales bacterium]
MSVTPISEVNIVVQQGGAARDAHNVRHQGHDFNQAVAAQDQQGKDEQKQTVVQASDESEQAQLDPDQLKKREQERQERERKKKEDAAKKKEIEGRGRLLNTVA